MGNPLTCVERKPVIIACHSFKMKYHLIILFNYRFLHSFYSMLDIANKPNSCSCNSTFSANESYLDQCCTRLHVVPQLSAY